MQRASEPQLIAEEIDNIIPFVRRKLEADGWLDDEDHAILGQLCGTSNRSIRYAEIVDFTTSLTRVGPNKRNTRRFRELFPELGPGIA